MSKSSQKKAPFLDAMKEYTSNPVAPFDVPGHHMGNINNDFSEFIGKKLYHCDVNAPVGLDNLAHPHGVILEAMNLMAEACHADHAFFLINGTSSGLQAAIISTVKPNETIILPRNVHKSIGNALVLSGAVPVYVNPELDTNLEIANQPSLEDYKKAIIRYPSAKALIVINPTYFGAVSDLKSLVKFAHEHDVVVIADEAHGAHYYFTNKGPISAMDAGADISAVSFHKTGGSLTQSSVLLMHDKNIDYHKVQETLNLLNTTSPSHILLASLDAARKWMVEYGKEKLDEIYELVDYAISKIKKVPGFIYRGEEYFKNHGSYQFDKTKFIFELDRLDISGFELFRILSTEYHVQLELCENYVGLAVFAIGNKKEHVDKLIKALKDISKKHYSKNREYPLHSFNFEYGYMIARPRTAYVAPSIKVKLEDALNHISKESIMIYPPGIPLILPGEVFTKDIIAHINDGIAKGSVVLSKYNEGCVDIIDENQWKRYGAYKKRLLDYSLKRKTSPRGDDYFLPFEGEKHAGTIILMPFRKDVWRKNAKPATEEYINVIKAIAKYETVYVGIHPSVYKKISTLIENIDNVVPIKIKYDDSWARDNTLIFVTNKNNDIRSVDFRFNAWGGEVDGLYSNYKNDDELGHNLSKKLNISSYYIDKFVLEGGSIACNGNGTLIVTEACLLSKGRNPTFSKREIEQFLKINLNVNDIIWLPHGILGDETNEHIDNFLAFKDKKTILLAWAPISDKEQYKVCQKAFEILSNAKDIDGNNFEIIKVPLPENVVSQKGENISIKTNKFNAKPRLIGEKLCASYVNFYQGKDFVILPQFGVAEDKKALKLFEEIYPNKTIVPIYSREILLGGGNIHCITMQIPDHK